MTTNPSDRRAVELDRSLVKVPTLTVWFWIAKLLTTAVGETSSDFLVKHVTPELAVAVGALAFVAALVGQFRTDRYQPAVYWTAALMVSVFGTMCADVAHVRLGVPYAVSVVAGSVVLAAIFVAWRRTEGTLSIHSVDTSRREAFYWATAVCTFALGTAVGDLAAVTFHLGFLSAGLVFAAALAAIALAFGATRRAPVLAFWTAYVLTRPLGASFADWVAKGTHERGLGVGDGPVTAVMLGLVVLVVAHLVRSGIDTGPAEPQAHGSRSERSIVGQTGPLRHRSAVTGRYTDGRAGAGTIDRDAT